LVETDPKAAFQHLHQALVEYQLRFIDLMIKGAGFSLRSSWRAVRRGSRSSPA
jgi:hypothetical protein